MKSVGETMAIGRTFKESLQKRCAPSRSAASACCSSSPRHRERRGIPDPEADDTQLAAALLYRHGHPVRHADRGHLPLHLHRPVVPPPHQGDRGLRKRIPGPLALGRDAARGQGARFFPTEPWLSSGTRRSSRSAICAGSTKSPPSTSSSTPAPPSSRPSLPTTTRPTRPRTSHGPRHERRSSSSAAAPTGSAKASSSITAASMPPSPFARKASRASW